MSFNQIINKKVIGKVIKDGATVTLSVATETSTWRRAEVTVDKVGDILTKSLRDWQEPLPDDTKEVCSRESNHTSDVDSRDHLTVVCIDSKGEGKTKHIPVSK